ncbi:MAG: tripartite tricarboxylate transporter substrate binding protein [Variovorax sp.]|nr:tripartite tricarboxylate transporter substrate binding protein [Variovorax sp.]
MKRIKTAWRALACAIALTAAGAASAGYPDKPIKLIVPYAPAGTTDSVARFLAEGMGRELKQPIVIENRPGASATVGTAIAARAPADGYTLLFSSNANLVLSSLLYKNLSYDVRRDLEVIGVVAEVPSVIVVNAGFPANDLKQFAEWAKANPNKTNYGSLGPGNTLYLASRMLETELGIQMTEVPYKGSSPGLAALLANDIQLMVDVTPSAIPLVKAGKLKALAVPMESRLEQLPDVPTIAEAGYKPFHASSWVGLSVPANVPPDIVATLHAAMVKVAGSPQFRQTFHPIGLVQLPPKTKAETEAYVEADRKRWGELVNRYKITLD